MTKEKRPPTDRTIHLDLEIPIREGLAAAERHGVTLSGSTFEKAHREARRLAEAAYSLSAVEDDRKRLGELLRSLADRQRRRREAERRGVLEADEWDASTASMEANAEVLRKRIATADPEATSQPARLLRIARLTREREDLEARAAVLSGAGLQVPEELDGRLDEVIDSLQENEAAFAAGAAELHSISQRRRDAERAARRGLATRLLEKVLPGLAEVTVAAMEGKVARHLRRPDKPLPAEVRGAVAEAEAICRICGTLTGGGHGVEPFADLLDDPLRGLLFPHLPRMEEEAPERLAATGGGEGSASEKELLTPGTF